MDINRELDFSALHERELDDRDRPPETIPAGTYVAYIADVQERSSSFGFKYYQWELRVPGQHQEFRLYYATGYEPVTKALANLIKAVTGIEPKGKIIFNPRSLRDQLVTVKVEIREFNRKSRNVISGLDI